MDVVDPEDEKILEGWRKRSYATLGKTDEKLLGDVRGWKRQKKVKTAREFMALPADVLVPLFQIVPAQFDEFVMEFKRAGEPVDDYEEEKEFNGQLLVHGRKCYDKDFLDSYMVEASSFKQRGTNDVSEDPRPAEFRAFLGPSGCGKTFSAIKQPFHGFTNSPYFCTLYMTVTAFWSPKSEEGFIDGAVQAWLMKFPRKKLKMVVHVVIDEAGFEEFDLGKFDWSIKGFSDLQAALQQYADTVIISAAGTNLDSVLSITTDSSNKALTKFRSQPWEPRHVLALVPNIRGTLPEEARRNFSDETATTLVTQWIKRVPVFRALTGNGRAAVKLVLVLLQLYTDSRNPMNNVAGVVDSVSKYYIRGNGLKGLTINQRREVVKAVLKVLQAPDLQVAAPVKFDVGDPDLEKSCHSLVDSNIDKDSQYFFLDTAWKCPCKVSACLTIVMFDLLGFASQLSTSWEGFENVCTLALIQDTILKTDTDFQLIQMKSAYPAPNTTDKAHVPLIKPWDVVVNGPRAPHGDAFGRRTIVQSKHSMNYERVECNLKEELFKSGLLHGDSDEEGASVHAAITALLYKQWDGEDLQAFSKSPLGGGVLMPTARNRMYPASLLETSQVVNYKVIDIKKGKDQDPDEDEEADNTWVYGTDTLEVPNKFCERITFVICINAMSIELKLESEKVDARVDGDFSQGSTMTESQDSTTAGSLMVKFTLTPAHVDLKGTLKQDTTTEPLRRWIEKHAKAGVYVCFRFCRGG